LSFKQYTAPGGAAGAVLGGCPLELEPEGWGASAGVTPGAIRGRGADAGADADADADAGADAGAANRVSMDTPSLVLRLCVPC
jgi:hypothetical protein